MKKLNLNKVNIVSLKNIHTIKGGDTRLEDTYTCQSCDPDTYCYSTGDTYANGGNTNDGRTFKSNSQPHTQNCSMILTECELADM
ncbi:hypothetical protein [uncultured Kordia sp.]|uniref:hypothetical protein n=1 Tax=uncultured Kordia sp. TaxID=507699 RepID=UPI00262D66A2|nr:hypothetical protein [uncultured Kordia sp.]